MRKLFGISLLALILVGAGCGGGGTSSQASAPVSLTIWGVYDDAGNYDPVIADYRQLHPNVSINFKFFRPEEYQAALIRALAEGNGPDIFMVHDDWMKQYKNLMLPLPDTLTIGYQQVQGTIQKTTVSVLRTDATISQKGLKDGFVDTVASDAILPYQPDPAKAAVNRIYGLPASIDTLALFWNKDLLNAAGIAQAPSNWTDFQAAVTKLTKLDANGNIVQSGAALGTSANVDRSVDILALLMMQNGTQMADANGAATFDKIPAGSGATTLPGLDATTFYTDFANPTKAVYTWNAKEPDAFDAFASGTTAMFLGYSFDTPLIRVAAPKLNFAISPLPQISGGLQVNFGNYWLYSVSKDSKSWNYAWDFIEFLTTKDAEASKYLTAANRPPALRSLIASQANSEDLAPFASQVLTAKTWYGGKDIATAESALSDLIDTVLAGTTDPTQALKLAVQKVNQTL